jgi:cell division control protein 45
VYYNISLQLSQNDPASLWLLISSLTHQFTLDHISESKYEKLHNFCKKEILSANKLKIDAENNICIDDEEKESFSNNLAEKSTILEENDYKLFLYRHWNLYDSLIYSTCSLKELESWKEQGKKDILQILALIGIPIVEAKQKYGYMKVEYKKMFKEKLAEVSEKYKIGDILFKSFTYQFNQVTQISALDFANCISVILNYPIKLSSSCLVESDTNANSELTTGFKEEESGRAMRDLKLQNFWTAFDLLSLNNSKSLSNSLPLTIEYHIALVNMGTQVIDKRSITTVNNFRYTILRDAGSSMKYFYNPVMLEQLGLFIAELFQKSKVLKKNRVLPYLIAILNPDTDRYLISSIVTNNNLTIEQKNVFSRVFRDVANEIRAEIVHANFNSSTVEIKRDDFLSFLETLSAK